MPPARWCQNEAHEIHRSKALVVFLSIRSSEHQAGDNTFWFGSTPYLRQNTLQSGQDLLLLFPFRQPHERTYGSTNI
ncbi:hypothetical protein TNCV_1462221 [Trichonephila clavipes]|nr:hypothetical protein TNCV_1462221 [Trichonephila clavipes]